MSLTLKKCQTKKILISLLAASLSTCGFSVKRTFVKGNQNVYKVTYESNATTDSGLSIEEGTLTETVAEVGDKVKLKYQYSIDKLEYLTEAQEIPTDIIGDTITLKEDLISELYFGSTPLNYFVNIIYEAIGKYLSEAKNNTHVDGYLQSVSTLDFYDLTIVPKRLIATENLARYHYICYKVESKKTDDAGTRYHFSTTIKARSTGGIFGTYAADSRRYISVVVDNDGFLKKIIFNLPKVVPCMALTKHINEDLQQKGRGQEEFPVKLTLERIGTQDVTDGTLNSSAFLNSAVSKKRISPTPEPSQSNQLLSTPDSSKTKSSDSSKASPVNTAQATNTSSNSSNTPTEPAKPTPAPTPVVTQTPSSGANSNSSSSNSSETNELADTVVVEKDK